MDMPSKIPFDLFISQLLDSENPLTPKYFYNLSDMSAEEIESLSKIWPEIPLWRRQAIIEDVEQLSADDLLLSFVNFCLLALQDEDANIRRLCIQSLWEYGEVELVPVYTRLVKEDPDVEVRAAATGALGQYVFKGEIGELSPTMLKEIEELLLEVIQGEDSPKVRRVALEALGFSSREEVPAIIESAFTSNDKYWIASALFAMGRSSNEKWKEPVLAMFNHAYPLVRMEAVRAAGELEIKEAIPSLIELLDEHDDDFRTACIWALSQIGGEGVRETLEELLNDAQDDEDIEFLESALENLEFSESMDLIPLFDINSDEDGEDLALYEDLYHDEDQDD